MSQRLRESEVEEAEEEGNLNAYLSPAKSQISSTAHTQTGDSLSRGAAGSLLYARISHGARAQKIKIKIKIRIARASDLIVNRISLSREMYYKDP